MSRNAIPQNTSAWGGGRKGGRVASFNLCCVGSKESVVDHCQSSYAALDGLLDVTLGGRAEDKIYLSV